MKDTPSPFVRLFALLGVAWWTSLASIVSGQELRGTWLTTTANDAIATPEKSAESMRKLRAIGINTVFKQNDAKGNPRIEVVEYKFELVK